MPAYRSPQQIWREQQAQQAKAPPSVLEQIKDQAIDLGKGYAIKKGAEYGLEALGGNAADAGGYLAAVNGLYKGSKVLGSNGTPDQKMDALTTMGQDAGLNVATAGIYGIGKMGADKLTGGKASQVQKKYNDVMDSKVGAVINPLSFMTNKAFEKGLSLFGSGKGEDQVRRDAVRKMLQKNGFFGETKDDWSLDNPDGTSFDVGKDGGAKLGENRSYYDIDTSNKSPVQAQAIGAVNPLAYLITGGDEKLATNFAGYFTNTIMQGDGATNQAVTTANALDKYRKAGYDTPQKAMAGIDDLVKAGKLDPEKAAAFKVGIGSVFGAPQTQRSDRNPNGMQNQGGKRRDEGRRRRPSNVYQLPEQAAPQVISQNTTAPMGSNSPYGDQFAQSLANIYMSNQGLA